MQATRQAPLPVEDDGLVLPWWYSWWRVALISVVATLAAVGGFAMLAKAHQPGAGSVDAGFLQDMRAHHDQAVEMGLLYMDRPGVNPLLSTMAGEVVTGQSQEIGIMVEMLSSRHLEEENSTGTAMSWMGPGMSAPSNAMPGLATDAQLKALQSASGPAADDLFVQLMTAHHEGADARAREATLLYLEVHPR